MTLNTNAIIEGVKEVARLALFAALGAVIAYATSLQGSFDPTSLEAIVLAVVLKFADKYVHKNDAIKLNGIAPF